MYRCSCTSLGQFLCHQITNGLWGQLDTRQLSAASRLSITIHVCVDCALSDYASYQRLHLRQALKTIVRTVERHPGCELMLSHAPHSQEQSHRYALVGLHLLHRTQPQPHDRGLARSVP